MAVCGFCRAAVHKDPAAVRELGKISAVLEDYSPIQVGTSGSYRARPFTVIGRIQMRYDAGIWNEWYLLFDGGGAGWLGDASGQYTLTEARVQPAGLPAFDALRVAENQDLGPGLGQYTVADKRVAASCGAEGELPTGLHAGWEARVADLRQGAAFVTLDYSDAAQPILYSGAAVTLKSLKCQLLRDDEQIRESAGRYRARVDSLLCPSCGTAIGYLPGLAVNLVCQSCATRLDAAAPQAEVLAAGERHGKMRFALALGAEGKIGGQDYRVLGVLKRQDDDGEEWDEYLLYSTAGRFFWLIQAGEDWWRSDVMETWPEPATPDAASVRHDKRAFKSTLDYPARVTYAAGAFNWRVKAGDVVQVREFEHGQSGLSAESNAHELTWSRSTPVARDQVRAWFKLPGRQGAAAKVPTPAQSALTDLQVRLFFWMLGINVVPLVLNFGDTALWLFVGFIALSIPVGVTKERPAT
jgi:hypothetical protein